jgi:NADH-quinone oxidoreductase subunit A
MGSDLVMPCDVLAYQAFAPVLVLIAIVVGMTAAILVLTHGVGPRRSGPVKDEPYESGMPLVSDARGRFHVRFYVVAILFLLFDVEVVFLWLWAPLFRDAASGRDAVWVQEMVRSGFGKEFLLAEMALFVAILLAGYAYAWRKGVFRWT